MRFDSRLPISASGSKSLTSAAKRVEKSVASNAVMGPTPLSPAMSRRQNSSLVFPKGVTAPRPVTTTRLLSKTSVRYGGSGPSPLANNLPMLRRLGVLLLTTVLAMGAAPRAARIPAGMPPAFVPPPILMYHRIDVDHPRDAVGRDLTISPQQFAAQLAYLKSRGVTGISMEQLQRRLELGEPLDHLVVLTFDDGYADQYDYALPAIRRYGDAATFYIVTGLLGKRRHLTWEQVEAMHGFGQDIAAHGVEHEDLSRMSAAQQAFQIDDSIDLLRSKLHAQIASYCYPAGRFNRATLQLVRSAGVGLAVTTDRKYVILPENRFELTRVRVRSDWSIEDFASALRGAQQRAVIVLR